eukprot:5644602-Prymnesium_polylepis.1
MDIQTFGHVRAVDMSMKSKTNIEQHAQSARPPDRRASIHSKRRPADSEIGKDTAAPAPPPFSLLF